MEPSLFARIVKYIRELHSQYATQSTAGFMLGGTLGYINYFGHIPDTLIHTWIGVWLWLKTMFWAGSSSIVTSACSKWAGNWMDNRQKKSPTTGKRKRNKA